MQKRWSICDVAPQDTTLQEVQQKDMPNSEEIEKQISDVSLQNEAKDIEDPPRTEPSNDCAPTLETFPLRKCRSSFDLAMDSLRKEIVSTYIFFLLS